MLENNFIVYNSETFKGQQKRFKWKMGCGTAFHEIVYLEAIFRLTNNLTS